MSRITREWLNRMQWYFSATAIIAFLILRANAPDYSKYAILAFFVINAILAAVIGVHWRWWLKTRTPGKPLGWWFASAALAVVSYLIVVWMF